MGAELPPLPLPLIRGSAGCGVRLSSWGAGHYSSDWKPQHDNEYHIVNGMQGIKFTMQLLESAKEVIPQWSMRIKTPLI